MFPLNREPFYREEAVTREELEAKYAKHPWNELREFLDSVEEGDQLIAWQEGNSAGGRSGYHRLCPDGNKVTLVTSVLMA